MKLQTILLLIIICSSCKKVDEVNRSKTLPFYNSEDFTPEWIAKTDKKYSKIHTIAPFEFFNQNGKKITNKDFEGKIYIADFFFTTCPSICPVLAKNMSKIQEIYKDDDDIMLLSHSVMPWVDTVRKIKEYAAEKNAVDNKWHLVTGDRDKIYNIARTSYFADEDFKKTKDESEFIHTENFVLVDKKGRIRGVYNGTLSLEVQRLKRHIELLKKES
ncbi:SCO family protein [Polaribacter aquimarinus]|uniref:SCO family protein n=1 Tax=Polaribacter aquimarinus TaxID=2100726 RepID=A0A2U2JAK4_9FLAO|nr:SCO family protein [Polaribacter aquimarinus]PWG05369.1 SCO family protein [Polaribacter aquimarinus]